MKIYEIIAEESRTPAQAFLLYFENSDQYIIELTENCEDLQLPLILSSFAKKGILTIGPAWSRRFVETRIIPHERQNLGAILRRYGLKEYDTSRLLELSKGRCAQDDFAILSVKQLPDSLISRQADCLKEAVYLHDGILMTELFDKRIVFYDLSPLILSDQRFSFAKDDPERIKEAEIIAGGYGIHWNEAVYLMKEELSPLTVSYHPDSDDLRRFYDSVVLSTSEVCKLLRCSRQYINSLIRANRLIPYRKLDNIQLFQKGDIRKLLW